MGPAKTKNPAPIHTSASIAQESIPANNVKIQDDLVNASRVPKMQLNLHLTTPTNNNSEIVTPINVPQFSKYRYGYQSDLQSFLIDGFTLVLEYHSLGNVVFVLQKNLSSIQGKEHLLYHKIDQEIHAGRVGGPLTTPPFPNIQVSPLGLVPKKSPGEIRMIHHLSYPEGNSINSNIPKHSFTVQYQSIDTAIAIIKYLGKCCLLAKID